jgi:hypothetical protein
VTPLQPNVFLIGVHQLLDTIKGWLQPLGRLTANSSVSVVWRLGICGAANLFPVCAIMACMRKALWFAPYY